ncbi:hypothetical protein [Agarivorans gilvus]|uniref:Uncharacterized protein n=1 Tax=Agarivorans gilvus TaxID=680279 RepID=A0ABQ1HYY9_9ALTE|nr:hypothetical protein [Agarivorans gilvus]GGA95830.1 hypothetical protein GCM10007414_05830 [Agarivorans gilvus]
MELFQQAQALFADTDNISVDTARQLQRLQDQAEGEEQDLIASLWEAFIAAADEQTYLQAWEEELI